MYVDFYNNQVVFISPHVRYVVRRPYVPLRLVASRGATSVVCSRAAGGPLLNQEPFARKNITSTKVFLLLYTTNQLPLRAALRVASQLTLSRFVFF